MRLTLIIVLLALASSTTAQTVTTGSLLAEMADLDGLARTADPPFRTVQFSSYDRRSSLPGGPDWFANSDGFGNEPIPGFEAVVREPGADGIGEYLICDIQQPGAIVRTWTAAIEGRIRVTLDGSAEPIFEGPAADFLMRRYAHFVKEVGLEPEVAEAFQQRYADYYPICFERSCRVVWIGNLKTVHFYHVQARLYPAGTQVRTFQRDDVKRFGHQATETASRLAPRAAAPPVLADPQTVEAGQARELGALVGPGAIAGLDARVEAADLPAALRATVLRIFFDGAQSPQVIAPIGDFFGAAPGVVPCETLPFTVRPDGSMTCRFVMPFERRAVITVENRSGAPVKVALGARRVDHAWSDRSLHFHARWRADHDLFARGGKDTVDLPFLLAHGRGHYVGTAVYIMNPCPVPTAGGNWWGEGDEKVFIDGEQRPSIFGTGSEDYFNYAWSESDIFQYPYFAQPICTGPDTRGYITNSRWHVLDPITFEKSIAFFMELYSHAPTPHLSYCRAAYWYARPGGVDDAPPLNDADLRVPPLLPWTVRADGGARGATIFEAENACDPASGPSIVDDVRFSNGRLARFEGAGASFRLKTESAGRYQVVLTCLSGPQGSVFAARLDGAGLKHADKERIELRTPHGERLVNVWLEAIELQPGDHTLTLVPSGTAVGVDFIWLKPAR